MLLVCASKLPYYTIHSHTHMLMWLILVPVLGKCNGTVDSTTACIDVGRVQVRSHCGYLMCFTPVSRRGWGVEVSSLKLGTMHHHITEHHAASINFADSQRYIPTI